MITVYGASDDSIEIEGDIEEEFNYLTNDDPEGALVAFSDGTLLRIRYTDDGVWRISPVVRGPAFRGIEQAPENDDSNYSDRATVDGAVWVVHGVAYNAARAGA